MAWGKTESKPEAKATVVVEFDIEGRSYRIRVESHVAAPYYFAQQQISTVSTETDLITGGKILVNWSRVGVLRLVEDA